MRRWIVPMVMALALGSTAAAAGGLPYRWRINANGRTGSLELATGPEGAVHGTLLGHPAEGWLIGRHLVLVRTGSGGRETWEGWISTPGAAGEAGPTIAGSFIQPGVEGPLPWFGTPEPAGTEAAVSRPRAAAVPAARPATGPPAAAQVRPAPPAPVAPSATAPGTTAGTEAPPTVAPHLPTGQPDLAGTWETPDGPLTIRQDGSRLTFVLPDRQVSGRLTGPNTLIGGFAPGCCKGRLEQAFTVIAWQNGTRWYRK